MIKALSFVGYLIIALAIVVTGNLIATAIVVRVAVAKMASNPFMGMMFGTATEE